MSKDSLTVIDNRTDETYDLPITYGTYSEDGAHVRSEDLRQIKSSDNDFGLLGYDPAYINTASCSSAVTYIDGAKGILRYRGYPIEQLVAGSSYLEVAYLLVYGELPSGDQLAGFSEQVNSQTVISDDILSFIDGFPKGSHTMGMLVSVLGALSVFYDDERDFGTEEAQRRHICRLIGNVATIGAAAHRCSAGLPYVSANPELGFYGNFLNMLFGAQRVRYLSG